MDEERAARLIAVNGYAAYRNLLVANRPPFAERMYRRITHPVVGDLVLETSARMRQDWPASALGYLRKVAYEPVPDCDGCGPEDVWYVEPLIGGETVRWRNATFIAIADSIDWHRSVEAEALADVTTT